MLSRRFIRIKVMQILYAYFHSGNDSIEKHERELFLCLEKIYDLYLYLLLLFIELREYGKNLIDIRKRKKLPAHEDLNPNTNFIDNKFLGIIAINKQLKSESLNRKITWENDRDIVQKLFFKITGSKEYESYTNSYFRDPQPEGVPLRKDQRPDSLREMEFAEDKKFVIAMYKNSIADDELLNAFFEEKNIHWIDDIDFVNFVIIKMIENVPESATDNFSIGMLYKNEDEDKLFAGKLFKKVIDHSNETDKIIREKTENWELERISFMDVLLMKMAIAEFLYFPTIPVKVTLNEYIELAKEYSTSKSSIFINGILDKLLSDFKKENKLQKKGRGLVEN